MIHKIQSAALWGLEAFSVQIEIDCSRGLPGFAMVGLPDSAVKESRERVISALRNCGYKIMNRKFTINLAPADRRKEGSGFDLAIAVGVLAASEQITFHQEFQKLSNCIFIGELGLDGSVVPVRGLLSMILYAKECGIHTAVIPWENHKELHGVEGIELIYVHTLEEVIALVEKKERPQCIPQPLGGVDRVKMKPNGQDYRDIVGQESLKRVMTIVASGGHNFLLSGTPGCGKSMAVKRLPTILPQLTADESTDSTRIYSAAGLLHPGEGLLQARPFRSPHHTISPQALSGGGRTPFPGELSLAHNGVLFLDELPEFARSSLEVLRQPLEDGKVLVSRASYSVEFPAKLIFGAAMNPCPCGYLGDHVHQCICTDYEISRYRNRLSGPLLDRIDVFSEICSVDYFEAREMGTGTSSEEMKQTVDAARSRQAHRYKEFREISSNAYLTADQLDHFAALNNGSTLLLKQAVKSWGLSNRGIHRTQKLALTLADMEGAEQIREEHVAEALQYRFQSKTA